MCADKALYNLEKSASDASLMKSFHNLVDVAATAAMRENRQINEVISQIVPAGTLSHIEFCRVEGGRLRVTVDGAAWIARLRFQERQLIGALRAKNFDCHTISYHVAPAERPVTRKSIRSANVHPSGANALEQAAQTLDAESSKSTDNAALKEQLLKLAQTLRAKQ